MFSRLCSQVNQYNERDLPQSLRNLNWCNLIRNLFIKNNYKTNMETITNILLTNLDLCESFSQDKQLRNILIKMAPNFEEYDEPSALNLRLLYDVFVKGERGDEGGKREKDELWSLFSLWELDRARFSNV